MISERLMAADGPATATRFPVRLLTVALVLTTVAFAWCVWAIVDAQRDQAVATERLSRIEQLRGIVVHLDEVLTMSARMAATTGEPRWEGRYHHFEPQLDAAIKETLTIGGGSADRAAAARTDAANDRLVEMEHRAFGLVRAGRREEARAVLFSPEYEAQKRIYASGISSVTVQIRRAFDDSLREDQRTDLLAILAAAAAAGTSAIAWASVIRGLRRWRADLERAVGERREAEEALQRAHDGLEVRIGERSAELGQTNLALQAEIVERVRSENALRASEERFRSYFELGLIGMAITSPAKGWIEVNDQLCRILGYERDELLQMTWADLTHPDDLAADLANFERVVAGEMDGYSMNKRFYRKDGRVIDTTISARCVRRAHGSVDYFLVLLQDITERARLEARLFQSQKMETVGKLAGGVAHEFNSIMTAIIGRSELLLDDLPPGRPQRQHATEIRAAAERAATLTRQLLAYGRKQVLQPAILDLNAVLAGMEGTLQHLMGARSEVRISPGAGLKSVKADAQQIEQVIMNMAMNAVDAMPGGGILTLETGNVTVDLEHAGLFPEGRAGEFVMLAITDTGAGIREEVRAHVFEPFASTKGVGQGSGLGLSTCYGIVKQSGGFIGFSSEIDRGTTFNIYLPQVEHQAKIPIQRLDAPDLPRGTETVLLVESDAALREMAAALLRRLGYTVLAASNGSEALSLGPQSNIGHIDVLITDVLMPHMSGKELAEHARLLHPDISILFTSIDTEDGLVPQGDSSKSAMHLQKPFTPSALARGTREALDHTSPEKHATPLHA